MILRKIKRLFSSEVDDTQTAEGLRRAGARIGENFYNFGNVDYGHAYLFTAGDNVRLAPGCYIMLHDASTQHEFHKSRVGRVELGDNAFIGARALILPNVKIGSNCIIGAGCVVTRDIPDNSLVVGNPARIVGTYDEYIEKQRKYINSENTFNTYWKDKTDEERKHEYELLKDGGFGYDE